MSSLEEEELEEMRKELVFIKNIFIKQEEEEEKTGDAVEGVEGEGGGQTKDQGDLSFQLHSPTTPHKWPLSTDPGSEGLDFDFRLNQERGNISPQFFKFYFYSSYFSHNLKIICSPQTRSRSNLNLHIFIYLQHLFSSSSEFHNLVFLSVTFKNGFFILNHLTCCFETLDRNTHVGEEHSGEGRLAETGPPLVFRGRVHGRSDLESKCIQAARERKTN